MATIETETSKDIQVKQRFCSCAECPCSSHYKDADIKSRSQEDIELTVPLRMSLIFFGISFAIVSFLVFRKGESFLT
jgi:hypothetical protein